MTDGHSTAGGPEPASATSTAGYDPRAIAGACLFAVGGVALLGIITAEVLYPGYTMLLAGTGTVLATYYVHRAYERWVVTVPLGLFALGVFGVGVFPGNRVPWHALFALLTFIAGGVAAILSSRVVTAPFRYLCITFGGLSLGTLASVFVLGDANPLLVLGLGGVERWVVYPILLWATGFGGYLMGAASPSDRPGQRNRAT